MARVKVIKQPKIKKAKVNAEFKEIKKDNGISEEADEEEANNEFEGENFSDFESRGERTSAVLKAEERRQTENDIEDKVEGAKTATNATANATPASYTSNAYNMPEYGQGGSYDSEERNVPRLRNAESLGLGAGQNLFRQQKQEWSEGEMNETGAWSGRGQAQEPNIKTYIDERVKEKPIKRTMALV